MAFILKIGRQLFSYLCNGRIDIIHIVKTQEILINFTKFCTKYCNGILSHTWAYVREEVGLGVRVVVGEAWSGGGRGHYFLFTKFFEIFYMSKIFYMVALGSFVTFSPKFFKIF